MSIKLLIKSKNAKLIKNKNRNMGSIKRLSFHCYSISSKEINLNIHYRIFSSLSSNSNSSSVSFPVSKEVQAPNRATTWSKSQQSRMDGMMGARFEQVSLETQPSPLSAIELIKTQSIRQVNERIVYCDGIDGDVALGHPRIFINLDDGKPISCTYCGLRFQKRQDDNHH